MSNLRVRNSFDFFYPVGRAPLRGLQSSGLGLTQTGAVVGMSVVNGLSWMAALGTGLAVYKSTKSPIAGAGAAGGVAALITGFLAFMATE